MEKEMLKQLDRDFNKLISRYKDKRNYKTLCINLISWWQDAKREISRDMKKGQYAVAVDLGLPSGTLWADRNVGAETPSELGRYYSWGNLTSNTVGSECDFFADAYNKTPGGALDGDIDVDHDAARLYMGEPWQMPTKDQFIELVDNCTLEWCNENGCVGMRFTSSINGNSVFFPAAGFGNASSIYYIGSTGNYWSSTWTSVGSAGRLIFNKDMVDPRFSGSRYRGFSIRAVQNPKKS